MLRAALFHYKAVDNERLPKSDRLLHWKSLPNFWKKTPSQVSVQQSPRQASERLTIATVISQEHGRRHWSMAITWREEMSEIRSHNSIDVRRQLKLSNSSSQPSERQRPPLLGYGTTKTATRRRRTRRSDYEAAQQLMTSLCPSRPSEQSTIKSSHENVVAMIQGTQERHDSRMRHLPRFHKLTLVAIDMSASGMRPRNSNSAF